MTGTTGRQRATKESIEKLFIPFPSLFEQVKIAEILATVDQAIQKIIEAIEKTERLKKGLMQELLTKGIGHKEFKETEIGTIPKKWEIKLLSNISTIDSGFGFPMEYQGKKSGKYPFIKVSDLNYAPKYIYTAENFINEEDVKQLKVKIFPSNTIIFPKIGMAIYLNKYRILKAQGTFDNNVAGIIPQKIDSEYLFYYFSGRLDLKTISNKTTAPSIRKSTLEQIKIPYPHLKEQQKIAEILSSVDKRIETLRKRKERLEKVKRGLMEDLLTGKKRVKLED